MQKFALLREFLEARDLARPAQMLVPEPADRTLVRHAHARSYVDAVFDGTLDAAAIRRLGLPWSPELSFRSRTATAGTLLAARAALREGIACNTAGGSHHAFADFGSGFCVFNDVAVAVRVLTHNREVERTLVLDLDVHQGDGTAAMLAGLPSVLTFSMHCQKNFPVRKQQSALDVALDPGVSDESYLSVLAALLDGLFERSQPDIVFYNAGVDPHAEDRLGHLSLSDRGLEQRDRLVMETCRGRGIPLACVIGGGYGHDVAAVARRHGILFETAASFPDW